MSLYNNYVEESTKEIKEKLLIKEITESMEVEYLEEGFRVNNSKFSGEIFVYGNEGYIPHFHVKFANNESCLCIFEALYANHERNHCRLSYDHLFGLNVFLMSPFKGSNPKVNNWNRIVDLWVKSNSSSDWEFKINSKDPNGEAPYKSIIKPNYTLTIDCKNMGNKYNHNIAPIK